VQQDVDENENEIGDIENNHQVIIKPYLVDQPGKIAKPNYNNEQQALSLCSFGSEQFKDRYRPTDTEAEQHAEFEGAEAHLCQ